MIFKRSLKRTIFTRGECRKCGSSAAQSQKAVSAHFTSEQILPFGFAWRCNSDERADRGRVIVAAPDHSVIENNIKEKAQMVISTISTLLKLPSHYCDPLSTNDDQSRLSINPCAAGTVYIQFQACFRSIEISLILIK